MSMKEAIESYVGEGIYVLMAGFQAPMFGIVVDCVNDWFVMKTGQSETQYFDMTKTISFWPEKV
jgi:hypothetical protein